MKVARAKLELIMPDEVNMEEYEVSEVFLIQVWQLFEIELWMRISLWITEVGNRMQIRHLNYVFGFCRKN